jgi:hypothetical protein
MPHRDGDWGKRAGTENRKSAPANKVTEDCRILATFLPESDGGNDEGNPTTRENHRVASAKRNSPCLPD